jgi:hypothetical protein
VAPLPSFIPFPAAGAVFIAFATAPLAGASAAVRAAFSPSVAVLAGFLAPVRLPLLSPSPGLSLLPALSPVQKPILILDIWHGGLQTNHREPNAPDLDPNPAIWRVVNLFWQYLPKSEMKKVWLMKEICSFDPHPDLDLHLGPNPNPDPAARWT